MEHDQQMRQGSGENGENPRLGELRECEASCKVLAERVSDWVWECDREGRLTYSNARVRELLGCEPEQVLGHTLRDLMPDEDSARLASTIESTFAARAELVIPECALRRVDEETIAVEIQAKPMLDEQGAFRGYWGVTRDITLHKRARKAFQEATREWETTFDSIADAIWVLDKSFRIIHVNKATSQLLGHKPGDLLGRHCYELVHGTDAPIPGCPVRRVIGGPTREIEDVQVGEFWFQVTADPILDESGQLQAIIHVTRDITDRKRAEEVRRSLEEQKRRFYRETILSATDGKLEICDAPVVAPYLDSPAMSIEVAEPSDVAYAVRRVQRACRDYGLEDESLAVFAIAVGEAATNAIKHAEGGRVLAGKCDDSVWAGVVDNGTGIESLVLPRAVLRRGFSTKPSMGLGYSIMLDIADQILLNTGPSGTTVILIKSLTEPEPDLLNLPDTWDAVTDVAGPTPS